MIGSMRVLPVVVLCTMPLGAQRPIQIAGGLVAGGPRKAEGIPAGMVLETGHSRRITALAFSPGSRYLASASEDRNVILWDPQQGREEARFSGAAPVRCLAFSPDGSLLASSADDGSIQLLDVEKQSRIRTLAVPDGPVTHLAISRDAKYLISAGREGGAVRLWDLSSGAQCAVLKVQAYGVSAVFFTADGQSAVAMEGGDMEMRGTLETFAVPGGHAVASSSTLLRAVTPDGRRMAVQHGQWGAASVAVLDNGREIARFAAPYGATVFSPDGEYIAVEEIGPVRVSRAATGETAGQVPGQAAMPAPLALADGASLLATAPPLGIQLWNAFEGKLLRTLDHRPATSAFAWTRDSKAIVTGGKEIQHWDIATGKPSGGPHVPADFGFVLGFAVSPSGNLFAVGGSNLLLMDRAGAIVHRFIQGTMRCAAAARVQPRRQRGCRQLPRHCRRVGCGIGHRALPSG
jgi:WD40 repeat protein